MRNPNGRKWAAVAFLVVAAVLAVTSVVLLNSAPPFSGERARTAIDAQVGFGPRVPGTPAHTQAGDWILQQFEARGWKSGSQKFKTRDPRTEQDIEGRNLWASLKPDAEKRVLLTAHWDTRWRADSDPSRPLEAGPGANDGASGVAVLLELAGSLAKWKTDWGVDIVLFDLEDQGDEKNPESFCLGSKIWGLSPHRPNYRAEFGIHLDMVGAPGAVFPREGLVAERNLELDQEFRAYARDRGMASQFPDRTAEFVHDDHVNVLRYRSIPMIALIDIRPNAEFFPGWHTHADQATAISSETLQHVGDSVLGFLKTKLR